MIKSIVENLIRNSFIDNETVNIITKYGNVLSDFKMQDIKSPNIDIQTYLSIDSFKFDEYNRFENGEYCQIELKNSFWVEFVHESDDLIVTSAKFANQFVKNLNNSIGANINGYNIETFELITSNETNYLYINLSLIINLRGL